ncbi:MAG: polysaccharide biosynthesis tyrosine autokinase [Deltaproteobacteria bacterium]|nr:polysaccharide biosynthesis tyrosine autokinase [Deltaproteobacteria bacterium]
MHDAEPQIVPYALRRDLAAPRPLAAPPPPLLEGGMLHDVRNVLLRQWRVLVAALVVVVGATAAYCWIATPYYRARATVLIDPRAPQVLNGQRFGEVQDPFTSAKYDYYQTQFQLLRSRSLIQRVVDELKLPEDPRFVAMTEDQKSMGRPVPSVMRTYLDGLEILPIRGTRLVAVEFEAPDPDLAAEIANAHAHAFVRGGLERLYGAIEQVRGFLQTKLEELQARVHQAEERVLEYQSVHRMLPLDLTKDVGSERLADLSRRLTAAETDRITIEAQYRLIREENGEYYDGLPAVLSNGLIQKLREDFNALEVEYALLAGKFRPTYPRLRQVGEQLAHARGLLQKEIAKVVKGIEAEYLAAQRTVDQLREEIEGQRASLLQRKDAEGELLMLTREVETTRALHDNLLARVKDLDVAAGSDTSNISVAEPASPKLWPSSPDRLFLLGLSVAVGLLLGAGLALLRDSFDRSIRDVNDLRRVTGLPTLAVVPDFHPGLSESPQLWLQQHTARLREIASSVLGRANVADEHGGANGNGHGHANGNGHGGGSELPVVEVTGVPQLVLGNGHVWHSAEAYRTLRTSLLLHPGGSIPRVILVTSAIGTEGKTTTAVNTAAALATCGVRVLLVDGDLRLPRCHESLGIALEPGLSEYLAWRIVDAPIVTTRVENLSFLPAGGFMPDSTELLASWRMWKLIERVRGEYDFVILDSPPLLAVSDGVLLANLADGVILVADRARSRRDQVRAAMQRLSQTGVAPLGAVLNRGEMEFSYYRYARPSRGGAPVAEAGAPAQSDGPTVAPSV